MLETFLTSQDYKLPAFSEGMFRPALDYKLVSFMIFLKFLMLIQVEVSRSLKMALHDIMRKHDGIEFCCQHKVEQIWYSFYLRHRESVAISIPKTRALSM